MLLALLFVTLPFVVRAVQPVLIELDREMEEAAHSLGASARTTFTRIVLPNLLPAIVSGAALAFARAVGEFGSIVLISGNKPFDTQVSSVYAYKQLESDNITGRRGGVGGAAGWSRWWSSSACASSSAGERAMSASRPSCRCALVALAYLGGDAGRAGRRWCSTRPSSPGSASVWDSVTTPAAIHAFWLTLEVAAIAVPLNAVFGVLTAMALVRGQVPGQAGRRGPHRPAVRRSRRWWSGLALFLLYGREGWFGDELSRRRHPDPLQLPGHRCSPRSS